MNSLFALYLIAYNLSMTSKEKAYSAGEELAHSVTHGVGAVIGVAVLSILVIVSAARKSSWEVVSCAIYGTTFILLFLASTLYHAAQSPRRKRFFKVIDHSAIYLLIAGTYTPFTLVPLRGTLGWTLFGAIWGCALAGILFKLLYTGRFKKISLLSYLGMGWFCVIAIKPLYLSLNTVGFVFLAAGGLCYSLGAIFYAYKRKWFHAIWHLFVLAGSVLHFFSILFGIVL